MAPDRYCMLRPRALPRYSTQSQFPGATSAFADVGELVGKTRADDRAHERRRFLQPRYTTGRRGGSRWRDQIEKVSFEQSSEPAKISTQQRLYFLPLPQGHGCFRPGLPDPRTGLGFGS